MTKHRDFCVFHSCFPVNQKFITDKNLKNIVDVPLWRTSHPYRVVDWESMDLTENPWFKFSERMELDFCRELAVQHKILLQEAGGVFRSIVLWRVARGVCCITFLFFVGVCCSCCCFCLF